MGDSALAGTSGFSLQSLKINKISTNIMIMLSALVA